MALAQVGRSVLCKPVAEFASGDGCSAIGDAVAGIVLVTRYGARVKRTFDFTASLAGLIVLAPLLAVLMLLVRMQSAGPAIFAQRRVGRAGRHFTCYKLRTMYQGTASQPTHLVQAAAVTRLGQWLRRWKLDELPQLYNVVRGDMSLVGPRPCLPTQTALIAARERLGVMAVRPGITGLAQVRGIDMSDAERLALCDAQYVAGRSFGQDLKLLLATVGGDGRGVDRVDGRKDGA